ncbi:uncharacterized protein EHS24_008147 [Apiotrichum porosum]|uniref:Tubby C-terminal domain-containing protein n=1 Tax=Apiotrichum porosum TaxID=105984 RepID=A0A427XSY6_9TREE|nr:uncharacterized protein EHS24_008147 [Apiotrichum porosum]RSH81950.1 hypothetical protein EHS24_008147 [Apiotrichum porosum]
MGNTESYETLRPLAPVTGGFGLYPEMLAGAPTTLILDANMQWTKVPFIIYTTTGVPVMQCVGYDFWNKKLVMLDAEGNHLFRLKTKAFSSARYIGQDAGENELFRLCSPGPFTPGWDIQLSDVFSGREQTLFIDGSHTAKVADCVFNGSPIARVHRRARPGQDKPYGRGTYWLEIAPGVDMALLAAICICSDEIAKAARRNSRNAS